MRSPVAQRSLGVNKGGRSVTCSRLCTMRATAPVEPHGVASPGSRLAIQYCRLAFERMPPPRADRSQLATLRIARCQHNYGNVAEAIVPLQTIKNNVTIADWQAQVKDDEIRLLFVSLVNG